VRRLLAALGLCVVTLAALAAERTLDTGDGRVIRYDVLEPGAPSGPPSAAEAALELVRLLAAGRIEDAAALSNAPARRLEVLRDYRVFVGEDEFRRVFGQFLQPQNRIAAEVAIGPRRLVIWDLGEAGHHLAAQYFVQADGKFVLDDVPSEARMDLRLVLQAYRKDKAATPSGRKD
jgi:hypothetical protein